ncbi:MAG TPA: hypothetical protein VK827_02220 [Lysobacter sp.]|nr:hypothetical protein [Lysobacter sp.]
MTRPTPRPLACLLGAGVLSLAGFTVSAQAVSTVALDSVVQAQVEATDASADETPLTATEARLAARRDADRNCLRHTGTRIVARDKSARPCVARHGSVYTREDLERTGEVDIGQALRKLDTSIR